MLSFPGRIGRQAGRTIKRGMLNEKRERFREFNPDFPTKIQV